METIEHLPVEIRKVLESLGEDLKATAQVYAAKRENDQALGQAFADGAQWMLARLPQFTDATMAAWRRSRES